MALTITNGHTGDLRPSFGGVLRGELFKLTRQRTTWISTVLLVGLLALPWLAFFLLRDPKANILADPLRSFIQNGGANLALLRVWSGLALIVVTAQVIGLDYQQGTIRIVLARGVERLQLLAAKLLTLAIAGAAILAGGLLLNLVLGFIYYTAETGGTSVYSALTADFWVDIRISIVAVVISMAVTVLLTAAATVLGRSVAVGMTVGIGFFAADNIGELILQIVSRITNNDFWMQLTNFLLGPNLNVLASTWAKPIVTLAQTDKGGVPLPTAIPVVGITPAYNYDITHILLVTLGYAVVFAAVAVGLTWRRDVTE
jgi:ABC-2 type transport system permease protein